MFLIIMNINRVSLETILFHMSPQAERRVLTLKKGSYNWRKDSSLSLRMTVWQLATGSKAQFALREAADSNRQSSDSSTRDERSLLVERWQCFRVSEVT